MSVVDWSQAPEGAVAHVRRVAFGALICHWIMAKDTGGWVDTNQLLAPDFGLPPGVTIRPSAAEAELRAEVERLRKYAIEDMDLLAVLESERDQLRAELESFNESVQEYMTAEMECCNHESAGINAQPFEKLRRNAKEAWSKMESASFDIGAMLRKPAQQPPIEPIPGTTAALAKLTIRGGGNG